MIAHVLRLPLGLTIRSAWLIVKWMQAPNRGGSWFDHIEAAVSGMIEDELSSKTIHNTVTLLRTMLAGKKGPSALRRGFAFHDPTMGLELPLLESRQITPPTPEQVWALIGAAKDLGGLGYAVAYTGAFTGCGETKLSGFGSTISSGLATR